MHNTGTLNSDKTIKEKVVKKLENSSVVEWICAAGCDSLLFFNNRTMVVARHSTVYEIVAVLLAYLQWPFFNGR